jgi:Diguanylate cyclase, GGDEF domain
MLARAAGSALGSLFVGLTLVVAAVAAIGVLGTLAATRLGISTSSDELTTSAATGKLAQDMDAAYATGEEAFLAATPGRQSRLLSSLPSADVSVTASIGVGGYPDHASTLERLERLADAALYLAKRHGRNRVEQAGPPVAEAADLPGPPGHYQALSRSLPHLPPPRRPKRSPNAVTR